MINQQKKTILHLIPGLYLGGSEKVLETIVIHQSKCGYNAIVLCFEKTKFEIFFSDLNIIHCDVQFTNSIWTKRGIKIEEYETIVDQIAPHYIHSHAYWTDLISHWNLRKEITYITHFHLCYDQFDNFNLKTIFSKHVYRWIDKQLMTKKYCAPNCQFIAASRYVKEFYSARLPAEVVDRISTLPNPVDDKYFILEAKEIHYDLLTVGRLEIVKNHKFLIDIVKSIKERGMDIRLVIVGDGVLKEELQNAVADLGLSGNIIFLGVVKDLREVFSNSLMYVHTSLAETFGLSILEAMAAGLPVVTGNFEGIDESVLINQHNVLIAKNGDLEDFIEKILLLKKDANLARKLSTSGRVTASKFSLKNYIESIDKYYAQIA